MSLRLLSAIIITSTLSGCITASPMRLPDGSMGQHITCGGAVFSAGDCIAKAGEVCGAAGYDILAANGESTPYAGASGNWINGTGSFNASSGAIVQREIFIRCKPSTN